MCHSISLIIPAYNEASNIALTIEEAKRVMPEASNLWEVVVVDDGSTDQTSAIVQGFSRECKNIRLIHHEKNRGYGAALRTGFTNARYEYVVLFPADSQFELKQIRDFLRKIDGADVVVGVRRDRKDNLARRINGLIFNLSVKILFGLNFNDIDCGFKLYKRNIFKNIKLTCNGALIDTEFLYKAKLDRLNVKQIDVIHKPRLHGYPTGGDLRVIFYAMRETIRLWLRLRIFKDRKR